MSVEKSLSTLSIWLTVGVLAAVGVVLPWTSVDQPAAAAAEARGSKMTLHLSDVEVIYGEEVTASGSTGVPGRRDVVLQHLSEGKWVNSARAMTSRDGRYKMRVPRMETGTFRAVAPVVRARGLAARASRSIEVTLADELLPGESMRPEQFIGSRGGGNKLVMQDDGNLVMYGQNGAVWQTATNGAPSRELVMQTDGNLVIYAGGSAIWESGTTGFDGTRLSLQTDSNLVLYQGFKPLWSRGSGTLYNKLRPGDRLNAGDWLRSTDGRYNVVMQHDGNLVQYGPQGAGWQSGSGGTGDGAFAVMQNDGNLVVYDANSRPMWASGTSGRTGSEFVVQDDGNLVVYQGGSPVWARFGLGSTPGSDSYPDADAVDCSRTFGIYSWCKDGQWLSSRRFAYRNCTDYVAWRKGMVWSEIQSGGSGHAVKWRQGWLDRGRPVGTTPRVGAVAWWGSSRGSFGHVAYVIAVNDDGSARVAQYNRGGSGSYSEENVRAEAYLY